MSALQCPDVQTCFLSEYMQGRWIAKIKINYPLYNMLQCLWKETLASISGQDEVKIFVFTASAKYSYCQIKVLSILWKPTQETVKQVVGQSA